MQIRTSEGTENVVSSTQGNLNTILGAAGTLLGLMNGGSTLLGNRNSSGYANGDSNPDARYVTKGELNLIQQLMQKDTELSAKDAALALKESEAYTDKKMVEVYTNLDVQLGKLRDKVDANQHEQMLINAKQGEWNATATGTMSSMATQIAALQGITKLFVPEGNVCRQSCGCCAS